MIKDYHSGKPIDEIAKETREALGTYTKQLSSKLEQLKTTYLASEKPTQTEKPIKKFHIVGAGLAGLCLAVKLSQKYPNTPITIYEKKRDLQQTSNIKF